MAEFCETCPLRGDCDGFIEKKITMEISYRFGSGDPIALTKCYDRKGNASNLIITDVDPDNIISEIDTCPEPEIIEKRIGIISKRTESVIICSALNTSGSRLTGISLNQAFDHEVDKETGYAAIEKELSRVESRRFIRRRLLPLGTVALTGIAVSAAGFTERSFVLADAGGITAVAALFGLFNAAMKDSIARTKPRPEG